MAESVLVLGAFFHRIQDEKVQESLMDLGVSVYNIDGTIRDSYLILREFIAYLDILWERKEYSLFYFYLESVIGKVNLTRFITYFLNEDR